MSSTSGGGNNFEPGYVSLRHSQHVRMCAPTVLLQSTHVTRPNHSAKQPRISPDEDGQNMYSPSARLQVGYKLVVYI